MNPALVKMMLSTIGLDAEQALKLKTNIEIWLENQNKLFEKINLLEKQIDDIHNIMILFAEKKGVNYDNRNNDC